MLIIFSGSEVSFSGKFYVFHGNDFSSDQLDLITAEVKNRRHILNHAVKNLEMSFASMQKKSFKAKVEPTKKIIRQQENSRLVKSPASRSLKKQQNTGDVLKGRVSYKVKGPGGRMMNIAEIKKLVDSFYDDGQGIIKQ